MQAERIAETDDLFVNGGRFPEGDRWLLFIIRPGERGVQFLDSGWLGDGFDAAVRRAVPDAILDAVLAWLAE